MLEGQSKVWPKLALATAAAVAAAGAIVFAAPAMRGNASAGTEPAARAEPEQARRENGRFYPSASQWAALTVRPVQQHAFRTTHVTEGKIAVNEDISTPIFSPYAGRVTRLLVAPGEDVRAGQPLFVLEAADSVQMQNDFIAALSALSRARSQSGLAEAAERRLRSLHNVRAASLREWEQAQADLTTAQGDLRNAKTALEAMRNRLRMLGKTDAEIDKFQETGEITSDSTIHAPLPGTIVQRRVGPGQYITAGASDPVFVVGDLSTVWLTAFVRETDAWAVKTGQAVEFSVLAGNGRRFQARIDYVGAAIDPASRRLMVRATVDNAEGLLKPEMFASVTLVTGEGAPTPAVPREAVIYEGSTARVWVVRPDESIALRHVRLGLTSGRLIQVLDGLAPDERIVTGGSLFIDRIAAREQS